MEDEVSMPEVFRLTAPRQRSVNTKARWENVFQMWEQGKTLLEIGRWIGRSESTARQLLKRAAIERQKQPGFVWPTDKAGRKICDIPHPMPRTEDPRQWSHARGITWNESRGVLYCPVCRGTYFNGRPLKDIFADKVDENEF